MNTLSSPSQNTIQSFRQISNPKTQSGDPKFQVFHNQNQVVWTPDEETFEDEFDEDEEEEEEDEDSGSFEDSKEHEQFPIHYSLDRDRFEDFGNELTHNININKLRKIDNEATEDRDYEDERYHENLKFSSKYEKQEYNHNRILSPSFKNIPYTNYVSKININTDNQNCFLIDVIKKQLEILTELEKIKASIKIEDDMSDIFAYFAKSKPYVSYSKFKYAVRSLVENKELIQNNDLMYLVYRRFDSLLKNKLNFARFAKIFISNYEFKENIALSREIDNFSPATEINEGDCKGRLKTQVHKILEAYLIAESKLEELKASISSRNDICLKYLYLEFFKEEIQLEEGNPASILSSKVNKQMWNQEIEDLKTSDKKVADLLFSYYDANDDGYITYAEFVEELLPKIGSKLPIQQSNKVI